MIFKRKVYSFYNMGNSTLAARMEAEIPLDEHIVASFTRGDYVTFITESYGLGKLEKPQQE